MATTVLYAGCPVCGQNLRSRAWIETFDQRPISIAHETRFARRSIERRELPLGEPCSPDAMVIVGENAKGKPIFEPARSRFAPDWWPALLKRSLIRAATALGFHIVDGDDKTIDLHDSNLTDREFRVLARDYVSEAEQLVNDAQAELEFRKKEAARAATARR